MSILNLRELKYNLATVWVEANLPVGVETTWLNENVPARGLPFVGMLVRNLHRVGRNDVKPPDDLGMAEHRGVREFIFELQAFGKQGSGADTKDAVDILQNLKETLQYGYIRQELIAKGIFYVGDEDVLDTASLFGDSKIESRASMDVRFRIAVPYGTGAVAGEEVGVIESVEVTGSCCGSAREFTVSYDD